MMLSSSCRRMLLQKGALSSSSSSSSRRMQQRMMSSNYDGGNRSGGGGGGGGQANDHSFPVWGDNCLFKVGRLFVRERSNTTHSSCVLLISLPPPPLGPLGQFTTQRWRRSIPKGSGMCRVHYVMMRVFFVFLPSLPSLCLIACLPDLNCPLLSAPL